MCYQLVLSLHVILNGDNNSLEASKFLTYMIIPLCRPAPFSSTVPLFLRVVSLLYFRRILHIGLDTVRIGVLHLSYIWFLA